MDYSVFHLHFTQVEGNNNKIGLKKYFGPNCVWHLCLVVQAYAKLHLPQNLHRDRSHSAEAHETRFMLQIRGQKYTL